MNLMPPDHWPIGDASAEHATEHDAAARGGLSVSVDDCGESVRVDALEGGLDPGISLSEFGERALEELGHEIEGLVAEAVASASVNDFFSLKLPERGPETGADERANACGAELGAVGVVGSAPRIIFTTSRNASSRSGHDRTGLPSRGAARRLPNGIGCQSQARRITGITCASPAACLSSARAISTSWQ